MDSNEAQALSFVVREVGRAGSSNYFTQQPQVRNGHELSYVLAPHVSGLLHMQIHLKDNGGTENGGSDASAVQYFDIDILARNDEPAMRLECSNELLNPTFSTLECEENCKASPMPPSCRALLTVQQACKDCNERYKVDGDCLSRFYLEGFAADIRPDALATRPEEQQLLHFELVQIAGLSSTFAAGKSPAIDNVTGDLSFCLVPGYSGVNVFEVSLRDDGFMLGPSASTSGPLAFGPFELTVLVNPVNMPPQYRFRNGSVWHVWESSGRHTESQFLTDIQMSPHVNGLDLESAQGHTFSVAMHAHSESLFQVRPQVHPNGTLTFVLAHHAAGVVFLWITITDDGDQHPTVHMVGSLGGLDHAHGKQGSTSNSSMQILELVVSDALMQVRLVRLAPQHAALPQVQLEIAEALSIRPALVWWEATNGCFVVAVGRLQDLLMVASQIEWPVDEAGPVQRHLGTSNVTLALYRRNFDHVPAFTVTQPVKMSGFHFPASNPKKMPCLIADIKEVPFTILSITGVSQLEWLVDVSRYKSEISSSTWVSDGTDGGVLAAMPIVTSECTPGECQTTANLTLAQGPQRRNGVVEIRVVLKGQTMNVTRMVVVETILVLTIIEQINITEDEGRHKMLANVPELLKPQSLPCAVRILFAGNLSVAPTTLRDIQFVFSMSSSYSGDTSILKLASLAQCLRNPPPDGMALNGTGGCRALLLITVLDSSGIGRNSQKSACSCID